MKPRPTQSGVRENTASSRQHVPRRAMNASVLQSDPLPAPERPHESTHEPVSPIKETCELSPTEPGKEATGGGESRPITSHPRTVKRMARAGKVPGHFRFGRWYFYASELDCWMRMELHSARHPWGSNIKEDVNV